MKIWIRRLKSKDDEKGMTIIELMVSIVILLVALLGIEMSVAAGLAKLKDQQITRGAAECARVVMEYFSTIPIDQVYENHATPGDWVYSSFGGGGFPALNAFVWNANSTCRDYSDPTHPIGKQVQMRYALCPACVTHTEEDPETMMEWTTCYYELKVMISYNGLIYGGPQSVTYTHKFTPVDMSDCETICGTSTPGEDKINPCPSS